MSKALSLLQSDRLSRMERRVQLKGLIQQDKAENPAVYDRKRSESGSSALLSPFLALLPYFVFVELPSTFGVSTGASIWTWGIGLLPFAVFAARFANVDRMTYLSRQRSETRALLEQNTTEKEIQP